MEPVARIELATSSLPRKRSTPELHWRSLSGRRGSNPRPSAWKADALPTELLPQFSFLFGDFFVGLRIVSRSLPRGNFLHPHSSASKSLKNKLRKPFMSFEPMEGIEPTTPRLQITCSGQLSYIGNAVFPSVSVGRFRKGLQR